MCVRLDKIPGFLHKYADTILRTGKYLNVIQQCDKSAQWAALQPLEYLTNPEHYLPIIDKVQAILVEILCTLFLYYLDASILHIPVRFTIQSAGFVLDKLGLGPSHIAQRTLPLIVATRDTFIPPLPPTVAISPSTEFVRLSGSQFKSVVLGLRLQTNT